MAHYQSASPLAAGVLEGSPPTWGDQQTPSARRAQVPGAPTVKDFVHNVGANCVRPKGTLSKRKSLITQRIREPTIYLSI